MLIENKRIFLYHKDRNSMQFSFYDTEKSVFKEIIVTHDNYDLFIKTMRDDTKAFCGYGNSLYEDIIVNELISKPQLFKEMSNRMFDEYFKQRTESLHQEWTDELKQLKYANLFHSFDLSVLLFAKNVRPELEDLRYTLPISSKASDIEILRFLFIDSIPYINARLQIETRFNIDLINTPPVDIGLYIARKCYCEKNKIQWKELVGKRTECGKIKLSECVNVSQYNIDEFPTITHYLDTEVFIPGYNTVDFNFLFQDIKCRFSLGGIKAFKEKGFYKQDEETSLLYIDAKSFYPSIFVNKRIYPQHLNASIVDIMKDMLIYRFESDSEQIVNQMKVGMNSMIGKMMIDSWMYDPWKHTELVLTGNLIILEILSAINQNVGSVLQVNNDGIIIQSAKSNLHKIINAVDLISIKHNIGFRYIELKKLLLHSISNYIYVDINGKTIKSGIFNTVGYNYGKNIPADIIPNAVYEYFFNNNPVSNYIRYNNEIKFDFTEFIKAPDGYVLYNGQTFDRARIYYSTNGKNVFKAKQEFDKLNITQKINQNTTGVVLWTDSCTDLMRDDLDYQYYINEAYKIINEIEHKQLTLF